MPGGDHARRFAARASFHEDAGSCPGKLFKRAEHLRRDRGSFKLSQREALFLMWRAILEPALLFALPFAAYTIYLVLRQNYPFAVEHWTKGAVSTLTLAGLAIAVAGMIAFGIFAPRHEGAYVPAHIENGKIVPGRMQ